MTALLASVMSVEEAETVLAGGADIVDLKDPRTGALGALPDRAILEAVARIAGRRPISATAGDLPMNPQTVSEAVARIARTGVDFVKVGLFPGGDRDGCLDALAGQAARGARLVAVMFADLQPDFGVIEGLARRGFAGVMLDTAGKERGGLRRHVDDENLRRFVGRGRDAGLLVGLAGSLGLDDVAPLLELGPDYLGFRGALTLAGRESALDPAAVRALRGAIPFDEVHRPPTASRARAAAGAQRAASSLVPGSAEMRSAKST